MGFWTRTGGVGVAGNNYTSEFKSINTNLHNTYIQINQETFPLSWTFVSLFHDLRLSNP